MRVNATLKAKPGAYEGLAPALIKFEGTIEVRGLSEDCDLQYHFLRSDGANDRQMRKLRIKKPGGVFPVVTSWQLSPPQYTGWEAIEVIAPERIVSNHAQFSVVCRRPDLAVEGFDVLTNSRESWVKFAAVIANVGNVDVAGPFKIIIGAGIDHWVTVQSTIDVPGSVVIPKNGKYTTQYAAEQQLFPNREYWVDIILDPNRQLNELNRANDRLQRRWMSPKA